MISILTLVLIFIDGTSGHMFDFSSPIHYVDSCGPTGSWSLEGKVTLSSSDLDFFAPTLIFRTTTDLCSIDVYSCGQNVTSLENSTDVCMCTNKTGNVLSVVVRRQLRANETGQMLQVAIPALDIFNPVTTQANIGVIPPIYEANVTLTYQLDQAPAQTLLTSQNLSVCDSEYSQVTVCAENLPPGSLVSLTAGSQENRSPGPCVHVTEMFDFSHVDVHDVTARLDDNRGCPVKESFIFHVHEKDCRTTTEATTSTTTTTTTTTATTTSTTLPTTTSTTPAPTSCAHTPSSLDREVVTLPTGVSVLCDTVTEGGGWIIFQRRISDDIRFNRNWADYRAGFGDLNGNFWLGLEKIHDLCGSVSGWLQDKCELRIDLKHRGSSYFAKYSTFYIGPETDNYRLHIATYSGTAGDGMTNTTINAGDVNTNGIQFSTPDRDNDNALMHCAASYSSGWWFNACMLANLNGEYGNTNLNEGIKWYPLNGSGGTVDFTEMKVRRTA